MAIWYRTILLIALASVGSGCRGCDGSVEGTAPQLEPGHPIDRCSKALAAIAQLPPEQLSQWPDVYAQGCAGLYKQPRCHAAWLAMTDAAPPDRTKAVIVACSDEYCPIVQQPPPAICGMDRSTLDAARLTAYWADLHAYILARELGTTPDSGAVEAINRLFVPVSIPVERPGDAALTQPALVIRITLVGGKAEVTIGQDGGDKKWVIPASPADTDMKDLKQEFVRTAPTPDSRAVIESTGEVPYGAVMKVLESAKEAGYSKIALSVSRL